MHSICYELFAFRVHVHSTHNIQFVATTLSRYSKLLYEKMRCLCFIEVRNMLFYLKQKNEVRPSTHFIDVDFYELSLTCSR